MVVWAASPGTNGLIAFTSDRDRRAFINQVAALARSRRLSPSLAQVLIDAANAAISRIEP